MIHFDRQHKITNEFIQVFQTLQKNENTQPDAFRTIDLKKIETV